MTTRIDIVAASVPAELRQAVANASTREQRRALGAWAADLAESVLPVWEASFAPRRGRWPWSAPVLSQAGPEPREAIQAARACAAGEITPQGALAAAEACSAAAAHHLRAGCSLAAYKAAMAAAGAARASAALDDGVDASRLLYEVTLTAN